MFKDLEDLIREKVIEDEKRVKQVPQNQKKSPFFGESLREMINLFKIAFKEQPTEENTIRDLGKFMADRSVRERVLGEIAALVSFILAVATFFAVKFLITTEGSPFFISGVDPNMEATGFPLFFAILIFAFAFAILTSIISTLFDISYVRKVRRVFEKKDN